MIFGPAELVVFLISSPAAVAATGGAVARAPAAEAGGAAEADASLKAGDQLVAVAGTTVKGADFDACLGAIQASSGAATRLVFFRGPARLSEKIIFIGTRR